MTSGVSEPRDCYAVHIPLLNNGCDWGDKGYSSLVIDPQVSKRRISKINPDRYYCASSGSLQVALMEWDLGVSPKEKSMFPCGRREAESHLLTRKDRLWQKLQVWEAGIQKSTKISGTMRISPGQQDLNRSD